MGRLSTLAFAAFAWSLFLPWFAACGARTSLGLDDAAPADAASPRGSTAPLGVGCPDAPGVQPGSPWPVPRRCPTHAASSPVLGPTSPHTQWSSALAAPPVTYGVPSFASQQSAIAADGTIYVATTDGLLALDATGSVEWQVLRGSWVTSLAVGRDGNLYTTSGAPPDPFTGLSGVVTALRPTGAILWSYTPPCGGANSVSLGADGSILVPEVETQDDCVPISLIALRPDGTVAWTWPLPDGEAPSSPPSVGLDGAILLATWNGALGQGRLTSLTVNGAAKWRALLPYQVGGPFPVVGPDGTVYLIGESGTVAVGAEGQTRWVAPDAYAVAVSADGTVYATTSFGISSLRPDGSIAWTAELPDAASLNYGFPVVTGDSIVAPSMCPEADTPCTPGIVAFDLRGHIVWTLTGVRPAWLMMGTGGLYDIDMQTSVGGVGPYALVSIGP